MRRVPYHLLLVLITIFLVQPMPAPAEPVCTITGTNGDDVLEGTDADDVICGLDGDDSISGGLGNDTLIGGRDRDRLKGDAGDDQLNGGTGNDFCAQNDGAGEKRNCEWPNPLLYCPVPGGRFRDDWHEPRSGGRLHEGNDIFARKGKPIRAPFDGVMSNGHSELGGKGVVVFGAEGYVYNGHMSKFAPERQVETGDIVGYVGNTGNARGGPTHDHFEWHPGNGDAVNPFPYLKKVCR